MLENIINSKTTSNKFSSQIIGTPTILPASKIPLGNRSSEEQIRWVPLQSGRLREKSTSKIELINLLHKDFTFYS